jgi:lysophospholipase L1-like esterase
VRFPFRTRLFSGRRDVSRFALTCVVAIMMPTFTSVLHAADTDVGGDVRWIGTWATAPVELNNRFPTLSRLKIGAEDVTLREVVHTSIGGSAIRIVLSNDFGAESLKVGEAQVALSSGKASDAVVAGSAHGITFGGQKSVAIPAGAIAISDPVEMTLAAQSNLAISLFVPRQTLSRLSYHDLALSTTFVAKGDETAALALTKPKKDSSWYLLKSVDVEVSTRDCAAIVTFGDSITDGARATPDANARWPDVLSSRLQADPTTKNLGVLNAGIGGNRILHDHAHDSYGPNALARFDRDVLSLEGVKYVVILEGINDIGGLKHKSVPGNAVSADDLIWGISQLIGRAHAHGIKVIGATLTPYEGAGYFTPEGEAIRETVNTWIRTSGVTDGVIDFDKATHDPKDPTRLRPAYDYGDHLHPNDAGYEAMGRGIDLNLFK